MSGGLEWKRAEAGLLADHVQLTFPDRFARAGEAYFDHSRPPQWIVFQAVETPKPGTEPSPHYAMYVARLIRDERQRVTGLSPAVRISPEGSANTCGWFVPESARAGLAGAGEGGLSVLFGSTVTPPSDPTPPGFSRDRQRYTWQFPREMTLVTAGFTPGTSAAVSAPAPLLTLPNGPGYAAECSYSPDGRHVLFTYRDPKTDNPDIWVYDTRTTRFTPLVTAKGYNGGPFFSPDGRRITYRSDRRGDNNLQLYVADLAFADASDPGRITGLAREQALTDNADVNWAPYWHPSGEWLIYTSSRHGHDNYEVLAIEAAAGKPPALQRMARVTNAAGFDGLPVISDDGSLMMWTSQRGVTEGGRRGTSQLWIARMIAEPAWEDPTGLAPREAHDAP
jgi:TolB protein